MPGRWGSSGMGVGGTGEHCGEDRGQQSAGLQGWEMDWPGLRLSVPGGKRDEDLVLPINSSLSVTLHQDQVSTGQH